MTADSELHAASLQTPTRGRYVVYGILAPMSEESTTPDLVELVRHLLDALSRTGGDVFARFFAPDAVFLTGVGRFEGREAIRDYVEDFNSSYDEQSFTPDEVHDLGNGAAWFPAAVTG